MTEQELLLAAIQLVLVLSLAVVVGIVIYNAVADTINWFRGR